MNKPKKVNVSLNPETMELLTKVRDGLASTIGFTPSYAQVIQHLINEHNDKVSVCSTTKE
jgi:hypothetical protein